MSLISIIIPVFNGESTIKETVDSVLKQTVQDWELIIINDGSKDSTLENLKCINDERIRVFSYPNAGVSISRNRGIALATGEFISFLDADDIWTSDKLEAQLNALQNNPQASVAYSWSDWIDESGQFLRSGSHISVTGNVYEQLLFRDFIESGSNPLIRRKALENVGGFEPSVTPAEDWDMWLRLANRYKFVTVPVSQILYRISPNSASFNVWKMEAGSLKVIERAFAEAPASLKPLKNQVLGSRYEYLMFKSLEGWLNRKKGLAAVQFLLQVVKYNPSNLPQGLIMLIVLFKITVAILLPSQLTQVILKALKKSSGSKIPVTGAKLDQQTAG